MSTPLRVLMIEEDPTELERLTQELQGAGFEPEVTAVDIERDYFSQLDNEHDVIISEYALLQFDALRALQILKEKNLKIPFIVNVGLLIVLPKIALQKIKDHHVMKVCMMSPFFAVGCDRMMRMSPGCIGTLALMTIYSK